MSLKWSPATASTWSTRRRIAYCWSGEPARGERALAPLTGFGEPLGRVGGIMPYAAWQQTFDVHAPGGDHYYWTTSIFDALDDALIDALVPNAAVREWARGLHSSLAPWARDGVQANFAGDASDWHVRTHDAATRAPGELAPEVRPGRVAAARTQRLGGESGQ